MIILQLFCDRCSKDLPKEAILKTVELAILARCGALPDGKDFTIRFLCDVCSLELGLEPGTTLTGETDTSILEANRASLERLRKRKFTYGKRYDRGKQTEVDSRQ